MQFGFQIAPFPVYQFPCLLQIGRITLQRSQSRNLRRTRNIPGRFTDLDTLQNRLIRTEQVSQPQALLGFRDTPLAEGESWLRRLLLGDLCRRLLSGPASPLYARLFEQRLITQGYSSEYSIFPEAAAAIFGGETRDPHALRAALEDEVRRCAEGVSEESFVRTLRALHGNCLRVCDDPATYVRRELSALFRGEHYAAFAEYLDGFTQEEASACFARWTESSQSLVLPLSADESSSTKGNAQ